MKIVISSGHSKYVRGASHPDGLDEVDEARRVVPAVAKYLRGAGHEVIEYHDDVSTTQDENLNRIVDFHNSRGPHDLDVSVHFNAYEWTEAGRGCEVLYVTQQQLAARISASIAEASGMIDRGAKKNTGLFFLNNTIAPAVLIEVAFVDAADDVTRYLENFEDICAAIANVPPELPEEPEESPPGVPLPPLNVFYARGPCSHFGGPDDEGVDPDEGLAFIYEADDRPDLFFNQQPAGTTGLARRLNPAVYYVACRWDYSLTPKEMLADRSWLALVRAKGQEFFAWPADWGPHEDTGRVADLSPGLMAALELETDDEVEVIYPALRIPDPQPGD